MPSGRCRSGCWATPPRYFPSCCAANAPIDIVTDQTSAHDPLSYLPIGIEFDDMKKMADKDPVYFTEQAQQSMAKHVAAMVGFMDHGAEVFDYGNSIRDEARKAGYDRAFDFPGFVPAYIRPQFEEGLGPFRWAALSGDPKDIAATDRAMLELFPDNEHLHRWITMAGEKVAFQGLPARICWLGYGERHPAGLKFNEMVASRRAVRPDRDRPRPPRLRLGGLARTARPRRCSTAPTRSPTGRCSTRWSTPRRARRGCRSTTAAGSGWAAPSTPARSPSPTAPTLAAQKLARVLTNDPGMGVIRHVDAGYEHATEVAAERGVRIPMRENA